MFEQLEQTMGAIWSTLKAVQAAIVKDSANHQVCSHSECVKTANLVAGALCRMDGMIGGLAASKLQEIAKKTDSETSDRQESGHVPPKGNPDGRCKWSAVVKEGSQAPTLPLDRLFNGVHRGNSSYGHVTPQWSLAILTS